MTDAHVRAMVQTGPMAMELQTLPRPEIGDDEALIRVEACGICGTDIGMYRSGHGAEFPIIRGHEPVGTVEEIGASYARRTKVTVGDRVAIDPFIRCGTCRYCLAGRGELCDGAGPNVHNTYAMIPLSVGAGLWGGFATHLVASSGTVLYRVPPHVPAKLAALFNALGAGVKWALDTGGVRQGSTVVVLGTGQRGLSCVIAALEAGASFVAVTGLERDAHKLALAKELGAHAVVNVERESVHDVVGDLVDGGVDVVIDTTPGAPDAIVDAIRLVRVGGTVVSGGFKHGPIEAFPIDELTGREITLKGALGTGADHYRRAIDLIAGSTRPLGRMQTHAVALEDVAHGIDLLAGDVPGEHAIAVVIETA